MYDNKSFHFIYNTVNSFIETKNELSSGLPSALKLNWKPEIKARKLVNLLKEKENDNVYTWPERVAHCKKLEDSTNDIELCKEIIAVSIQNQRTYVTRFSKVISIIL